ncbi:MAG: type IV toxin-antitoxin system AbiEi family antitoxin domain-containing protein [Acidobacteriota bacterium]
MFDVSEQMPQNISNRFGVTARPAPPPMAPRDLPPRPGKPVHSGIGIELVRLLSAEGDRLFTVRRARELSETAGLSPGYLRQALHHLVASGWLVRLRQGLYALSPTVPGVTPAHEFEIAMALVEPAAISHWSALLHHGLTEQIPREVFVLTTTAASVPRPRGREAVKARNGYPAGGHAYRFIRVKPDRYFGTERVWVSDARVTVTDLERTLLDGLARPRYCGDLAEVLHAFEVAASELDLAKLVRYALRLDAATAKRLGWVLERQGTEAFHLEPLRTVPVKGYRVLDASGPRRGPRNRRWMIQENLPGRVEP